MLGCRCSLRHRQAQALTPQSPGPLGQATKPCYGACPVVVYDWRLMAFSSFTSLDTIPQGGSVATSRVGFLIIGAAKSGTTSLFEYMRRHPQIHMPAEKELHFFNVDRSYRRGPEWYLTRVLQDAPPDSICGEATPDYMNGAPYIDDVTEGQRGTTVACSGGRETPEEIIPWRIKRALPDVKLICVLRDPVARAYSCHRMRSLNGVELRSFEEAIAELMEPRAMENARREPSETNGYVVHGEYARLIAGYLRVFTREQLMEIFSDELGERPAETLAAVFDFVGVSRGFVSDNLTTRYREAAVQQRIPGLTLYLWQRRLARIRAARAFWHALPSRVRREVDRAYGVTSYRVGLWNARRGTLGDDISPSVRRRLIAHFRADSEALGEMLGRKVPWLKAWNVS